MSVFQLSSADLTTLFEPDNIKYGVSIQKLKQWGKIPNLQNLLKTNFRKGISNDPKDHQKRIQKYGSNTIIMKPSKSFGQYIFLSLSDKMIKILCVAAIISLILGILTQGIFQGWYPSAFITLFIFLSIIIKSTNNYITSQQLIYLNQITKSKKINVIRSTQTINISVYDLLVGDIVFIQSGEIINVDGILIEGNLKVNEQIFNGQINCVMKKIPIIYDLYDDANPFLVSGSTVIEGMGLMVVAAVGINSYYNKLKLTIQQEENHTILQHNITILVKNIHKKGLYFAFIAFIIMLYHHINDSYSLKISIFSLSTLYEIIQYIVICLSLIVLTVSQSLALSMNIALTFFMKKMKQHKILIKNNASLQKMSYVDNICCEKTGTLSTHNMKVTKLFIQQKLYHQLQQQDITVTHNTQKLFYQSICNNSTANPNIINSNGLIKIEQIGNKTQCALIQMIYKMGYHYKKYRHHDHILKIFLFCQKYKRMATIYQDDKGIIYAYVKGSPDYLLKYCTKYINKDGKQKQINQQFINNLHMIIKSYANQSLRTLILLYKQVPDILQSWQQIQNNLTIIGLAGIKDPFRDGIQQTIVAFNNAGIKLRMITGGNKITAVSNAKQVGLLSQSWGQTGQNKFAVMQGKQFRQFVGGIINQGTDYESVKNIDNFKIIRDQLYVLASSSPQDKHLLAVGLRQLGHVVAMTGDSIYNSTKIKRADVEFSMRISGNEVEKQNSEIILLDDNFSSIITMVKWSRNMQHSIKKFIQFQLTIILVVLTMSFLSIFILKQSLLNSIQILWINLIMGILAPLISAIQDPTDQIQKQKPDSIKSNLITNQMWINIVSQSIWQIFILGVILFKGPQILYLPSSVNLSEQDDQIGKHYSILFNVFVMLQIFNLINVSKINLNQVNISKNLLFSIFIFIFVIVQLIFIKYGGKNMKTVQLTFYQNILCILLGSTSLFFRQSVKIFRQLLFNQTVKINLSKNKVRLN